jgi:hypothetical protein
MKAVSKQEAVRVIVIKRISTPATPPAVNIEWLSLAEGVEVELTSEDPDYPIEDALLLNQTRGWRAATPGPQSIRLIWSAPIYLRCIWLEFEEHSQARTQEFVIRASTREGIRDIVRQQFTFSPPATTLEREEYQANVEGVTHLELAIVPAIDQRAAIASLKQWRIA